MILFTTLSIFLLLFLITESSLKTTIDLKVHGKYNKGPIASDGIPTYGYSACTMKSNLVSNKTFSVVMTNLYNNQVFKCEANIPFVYSPYPKYRCLMTDEIFGFKINGIHQVTIHADEDNTYFEKSSYTMKINT